jgi:hypothetical protein
MFRHLTTSCKSPNTGLCPSTCLSRRRGLGLASSGSAASSCPLLLPSLSRPQVRTHNDVDRQASIPGAILCCQTAARYRGSWQRAAVAGLPLPLLPPTTASQGQQRGEFCRCWCSVLAAQSSWDSLLLGSNHVGPCQRDTAIAMQQSWSNTKFKLQRYEPDSVCIGINLHLLNQAGASKAPWRTCFNNALSFPENHLHLSQCRASKIGHMYEKDMVRQQNSWGVHSWYMAGREPPAVTAAAA